jgi:hypothetical protein
MSLHDIEPREGDFELGGMDDSYRIELFVGRCKLDLAALIRR